MWSTVPGASQLETEPRGRLDQVRVPKAGRQYEAITKERLAGDRFREIKGFIAYFWLA